LVEDQSARDAIKELHAQSLALQYLLVHICIGLGAIGPDAPAAVLKAFDGAANNIEDFCLGIGKDVSYAPLALKLIEELRSVVAGGEEQKRRGV
jgi:hypothetical protein